MKKILLITGASSGFGKSTAEKLLATGQWEIYAASRNIDKMKELEDKGAHLLKMDVTSTEEVTNGVKHIIDKHGNIDALLANAGYGSYGMIESVALDEIQYQYDVNVFGIARVIQAVLPHMRKVKKGRIVITTSIVAHLSMAGLGWYASTKHALRGVGTALRQEVKDLGIEVVMIEPGAVKTGFDSVAFKKMRKTNHPDDYKQMVSNLDNYFTDMYKKAPGPDSTVRCMIKAITAKKPKTVYQTTPDVGQIKTMLKMFSDKFGDNLILSLIKKATK